MPDTTVSLTTPENCVMVAGFQNIEDKAPPAATPAKVSPSPTVLCSRMPNAPAFASTAPIGMRTVALAKSVAQPDLSVLATTFAPALSDVDAVYLCPRPIYLRARYHCWGEMSYGRNGLE